MENEADAFRIHVRRWLLENCPPTMRTPQSNHRELVWVGKRGAFPSAEAKIWRMAAKGWTAPTWPVEYGGDGLDAQ